MTICKKKKKKMNNVLMMYVMLKTIFQRKADLSVESLLLHASVVRANESL